MCTVCGCGDGETRIEGQGQGRDEGHVHHHEHEHVLPDGTVIRHTHDHAGHSHAQAHVHDHGHGHDHGHDHGGGTLHYGHGAAGASVPGMSQTRLVRIEQDILAKNDSFAAVNRQLFAAKGVFVLNLMSSPGSGKTTLLARTLTDLKGRFPVAVIEGDQQTSFDADRIRATGARAIQINTGKGCHLDAQMITQAVGGLGVADDSVLFIENVGNLVCPAGFDLGEARKVVVLSVTEGEDKPLKYPNMFAAADLLLVTKVDLLPHLTFDVERMIGYARQLKPGLEVMQVSSTTGQGLDAWYTWIDAGLAKARRRA
ncbi:hydrogenase nickel incorporation protein HypB [Azospirillum sp.]|uniref:hydrogenase nickel incorporation protein HypB n=1 Tax=Azospirillum sp. TaxID=34012 RepID=UPI002D5BC35B|nr:hydrogenase nickel incorporation protein HypB [Azospirillum sp.]HYD70618.1 hydrogenase nickel incorporation protein HypB [Azospirillum sp.]